MERINFVFSGAGGTGLPAVIWMPEKPRATMQFIPGARHDILHDSPARTTLAQTALADWLEAQIPDKE